MCNSVWITADKISFQFMAYNKIEPRLVCVTLWTLNKTGSRFTLSLQAKKADNFFFFFLTTRNGRRAHRKCIIVILFLLCASFAPVDYLRAVLSYAVVPTCVDQLLLHFPFDYDFNDITCHNAIGVRRGKGKMNIENDPQRGSVLMLGGKAYIEVCDSVKIQFRRL